MRARNRFFKDLEKSILRRRKDGIESNQEDLPSLLRFSKCEINKLADTLDRKCPFDHLDDLRSIAVGAQVCSERITNGAVIVWDKECVMVEFHKFQIPNFRFQLNLVILISNLVGVWCVGFGILNPKLLSLCHNRLLVGIKVFERDARSFCNAKERFVGNAGLYSGGTEHELREIAKL